MTTVVPAAAIAVEAYGDPGGPPLFPAEEALMARAVDKRRREFTTVRHCARAALARLGLDPVPVVHGPRGAPLWPDGVVGSLTHCRGYRAAVLGRAGDFATIGIDAEPHEPLPPEVVDRVTRPGERARLADLGRRHPDVHWDRVLFSAKESVYKAWFPLTGRWLDFAEAEVVMDPTDRTFTAHLLVPGPDVAGVTLAVLPGRYGVAGGYIVTAVTLPV
jgi:4'-phosphopantetheinyl transferase EntD